MGWMMAGNRGKTGSVRGLPAEEATAAMLDLAGWVRSFHGGTLTRARAREWGERYGVTEAQANGLAEALERTRGVVRERRGEYRIYDDATRHIRHRTWRFTLGYARLEDAEALLDKLMTAPHLPDGLANLRGRLAAAVAHIDGG